MEVMTFLNEVLPKQSPEASGKDAKPADTAADSLKVRSVTAQTILLHLCDCKVC